MTILILLSSYAQYLPASPFFSWYFAAHFCVVFKKFRVSYAKVILINILYSSIYSAKRCSSIVLKSLFFEKFVAMYASMLFINILSSFI